MSQKPRRVSPALVIATLALVLALTGGAVAAGITGGQIVDGSITGKDIRDRSLTKADFRGALRGPRGFRGPRGSTGPAGPAGLSGISTVEGAEADFPPGSYGAAPIATCPAGSVVVGTGFRGPFNSIGGFVKAFGTFVGGFFVNDTSITVSAQVQAICARAAGSNAATASNRRAAMAAFRSEIRAAETELTKR